MSITIQNKLSTIEIDPPQGSWEKIAGELDDSASGLQFPTRLHELAIAPPATAWAAILAGMEAAYTPGISEKLNAAEVTPPAGTWEKITASLDDEGIKTIPERRRIPAFLRYAAAASIIGLLAFGALQIFKPGTNNETATIDNTTGTSITLPATDRTEPPTEEKFTASSDASDHDEDARNDAALEASKKTYARLDLSKEKTDASTNFDFARMISDDMQEPANLGYEEGLPQVNTKANTERYIVLMTPDGQFIRMSKKLSNLVCCVSGEEEDVKCKTQVDKWRKQIACSPTPHPGNFMDIVSLLRSLQGN